MSTIGKISENYQTIEQTTVIVNEAIVILKRHHLFTSDNVKFQHFQVNDEIRANAQYLMHGFLDFVIDCHDPNIAPDYTVIPKKVQDKFASQLDPKANHLQRLRAVQKRVKKCATTEEDFLLLDRIVTVLDKERGTLFKTLRTARG